MKFFNFTFHEYELTVKVYLPEKLYDSITVDLVNGRVDAEDLKVKEMKVKTVNGKIELEEIVASNVRVQSKNGAIHQEHVIGDISGNVTNGKILVETETLNQNMNLESVNGEIDIVTLTDPTNVDIDVEAVKMFVYLTKRIIISQLVMERIRFT